MTVELLISALNAEPAKLIQKMKVTGSAVLVNQCNLDECYDVATANGNVKVISNTERGIGLSRNHALDAASGDILLFADDDIEYVPDYVDLIASEFEKHPEADGIFFNFEVDASRATYSTKTFGPVTFKNSGRYPTYSLAVKRDRVRNDSVKLCFSPLFGGGAKYSCGEDSLFIMDCLNAGLKLFCSPVCLGREVYRQSTWFSGYTEKFFFDKGVLYPFLYGKLAPFVAMRFLLKHGSVMCKEIPILQAYKLMRDGMKEGKKLSAR